MVDGAFLGVQPLPILLPETLPTGALRVIVEKASAAAAVGGGGAAVYFGLTAGEWQIIGVVGGLLIGLLGLVINAAFQWLRFRRGD
jgi:hypothetical protein